MLFRSVVYDVMHVVIGIGSQLLHIMIEEDIQNLPYYDQYK